MNEWNAFEDNHGTNNACSVGDGWELHVHGAGFEGPASFQNQSTGERYALSSGDALYAAGMLEFANQFSQQS